MESWLGHTLNQTATGNLGYFGFNADTWTNTPVKETFVINSLKAWKYSDSIIANTNNMFFGALLDGLEKCNPNPSQFGNPALFETHPMTKVVNQTYSLPECCVEQSAGGAKCTAEEVGKKISGETERGPRSPRVLHNLKLSPNLLCTQS